MTPQEAIKRIEEFGLHHAIGDLPYSARTVEAFEMAVEALSAQPEQKVGKWISQKGGGYKCSECGRYALDEIDGNYVHVAVETPYCPYCGKKMEEQDG